MKRGFQRTNEKARTFQISSFLSMLLPFFLSVRDMKLDRMLHVPIKITRSGA